MKITFLLGAGASAEALPLVIDISESITEVINLLEYKEYDISLLNFSNFYLSPDIVKKKVLANLIWLRDESSRHSSIDTFAKKVSLIMSDSEMKRFKLTLSLVFTILQIHRERDKRYDTFFASILKNDVNSLPKNISVLSWNYDNQFELAFSEYIQNNSYRKVSSHLNINTPRHFKGNNSNIFSINKMNGSIGYFNSNVHIKGSNTSFGELSIMDSIFERPLSIGKVYDICKQYVQLLDDEKFESDVSFAWENDENNLFLNSVLKTVSNTDILVCIGYSFPFYNRNIDSEILRSMTKLSKIYIQDKNNAEIENTLRNSMNINHQIIYSPIVQLNNFNIPREYNYN